MYEGTGDGAQTLVLLHATGFPPQLWHPVARTLARDYRIIVPFYGDHRAADTQTGAVSWMTLADDLARFCGALNIIRPFVAGHSMGATVAAISEAACGLAAAALILIEPIFLIQDLYGIPFKVSDHPFASKSVKRLGYWRDEAKLRRYLQSKSLFQRWDSEILDLYVTFGFQQDLDGGIRLVCSPQREAELFMGGMQHDPWPLFPGIHCPAYILEGENSENRLYVDLKKASSLMPRGAYALMSHAGHLIPMERPQEAADRIAESIRRW
jgi:pimeloyl-ACP methyl ester carboxylesterase